MPIKSFIKTAGKASAYFAALPALALPAVLLTIEPTYAGGAATGSCVRSGGSVSCAVQWGAPGGGLPLIVKIPAPKTDEDVAAAAERDRKWVEYCKPVIRPDRNGVGRYYYAAAGCEYGYRGGE
jgi:hypothetical protein